MPVTFTRAVPVQPGEAIASRQLANLADAFNSRLRSGLGDPTWRIYFLLLSLYRQIRNSDGEFAFPPAEEFFQVYAHVDPLDATWPGVPAGETEGVNVSGAVGAWVHGNAALGLVDEASRANPVPTGTLGVDAVNGWDLAKSQRGGYDPATGAYASPIRDAAVAHERILFSGNSPHGLSYGSWTKVEGVDEAALAKYQSEMLSRMLHAFVREFRGSDAQRSDPAYHLAEAADIQRALTNQYHLAPAKGTEVPESDPVVVDVIYPSWSASAPQAAGAEVGPRRNWAAGFAMTGVKVTGSGLTQSLTVRVLGEVGTFGEVVVTPANPAAVLYFPTAILAPRQVRVVLAEGLPAGSVTVEASELQAKTATLGDLYALLRCSSAFDSIPDGVGTAFEQARVIVEEYFRTGCAVNPSASAGVNPTTTEINTNAVFDAVRRFSRFVRVMRRQEFRGYAVVDGKSVLWFAREFTPAPGVPIRPWEGVEEIVHTALVNGLTNEWLLDVELRPYNESPSSIFKPESYTDYAALIQRCHFDSPEIVREAALLNHVAYGHAPLLFPEAPPGWDYTIVQGVPGANNANTLDCAGDPVCEETRRAFYRSCRIYEPPVEIESVTVEGTEVKVTMSGRLHHDPTAPASIARDQGTWDATALRAEKSRTAENGLREYLLHVGGGAQCSTQAGNIAINSTYYSNPDAPYGSCYPTFRLTQLIPKPYADTNDSQDSADTHFVHDPMTQAELYLRAMCEGFVNGELSAATACALDGPTLYDFTFTSLCQQAFGKDRFQVLPGYEGFHGPLPNTDALAAIYNQCVSAVNLLTRVRVMLPTRLQCNSASEVVTEYVPAEDGFGDQASCGAFGKGLYEDPGHEPGDPAYDDLAWVDCDGTISGGLTVRLTGNCNGELWELERITTKTKVRFVFTDPDVREAIPEAWRDQFETSPTILVKTADCAVTVEKSETGDPLQATQCFDAQGGDTPAFPSPGGYVVLSEVRDCPPPTCRFAEEFEAGGGPTGASVLAFAYNGQGDPCLQVGDASNQTDAIAWAGQVPTFAPPAV